jgi:hypothetical protein
MVKARACPGFFVVASLFAGRVPEVRDAAPSRDAGHRPNRQGRVWGGPELGEPSRSGLEGLEQQVVLLRHRIDLHDHLFERAFHLLVEMNDPLLKTQGLVDQVLQRVR